jgi:hypothetical protein
MQQDILQNLIDSKNRVEKAKQAIRIILGDQEPLTIQETTIAAHKDESKNLPTVFVSYSHKDEEEKEKLLSHLGVLRGAGLIDPWSDDQTGGGNDWETDIYAAIKGAQLAILLITSNFLNSEFILGKEVPALLQRRKSEGVTVFPLIARACAWKQIEWLVRMNVRPKNGRPVWSDSGSHIDDDLAKIAEEIALIVKRVKNPQNVRK